MRFLRGPTIKEKGNLHSRISILDGRQVSRDVWSGHSVSFLASLLAPVIRPSMMTVSSNFASRELIKLFSFQPSPAVLKNSDQEASIDDAVSGFVMTAVYYTHGIIVRAIIELSSPHCPRSIDRFAE